MMCYHDDMKLLRPEDAKTVISLRMRTSYRNQLAQLADEQRVSLNQLLMNAIEKEHPPHVADRGD